MSTWEAIVLGFIQGLTEFLPISSSGHLTLSQYFLGFENLDNYILFDLICHLGTLLSIFVIFFHDIQGLFQIHSTKLKQTIIATLPLFPLALLIRPIHHLYNQPEYLGFFFMITALLLYLGIRLGRSSPSVSPVSSTHPTPNKNSSRDSLIIGLFQALAILPGVSRSGSTISAARMLGWERQEAITFSFLIAIPAILGGTALEILKFFTEPEVLSHAALDWNVYFVGFLTSFFFGWLALRWLKRLMAKNQMMIFVWYCLFLGMATTVYFSHFA